MPLEGGNECSYTKERRWSVNGWIWKRCNSKSSSIDSAINHLVTRYRVHRRSLKVIGAKRSARDISDDLYGACFMNCKIAQLFVFFLTAQRKQKRNIFNYALQQWKSWLEQVSHCIPLETSSYATESESPSPGHRGLVLFFLCFFASQPDVLGEGVCLTIRFWRWVTILDNTWELDVAYFLNATRCRTGGFCDCISRWSTSTI